MPSFRSSFSLTLDRLKEVLDYDPETGIFRWRKSLSKNVPVGRIAGKSKGAVYIRVDDENMLASRLAWFYVYGEWPTKKLGFLDGNNRNCAIGNLYETMNKYAADKYAYEKHLRKIDPDRFRAADITRNFGISLPVYDAILERQNGTCAVCRNKETEIRNGRLKWLAIDHCHETNIVRGLLCSSCNKGIGHFQDDPERLEAAAAYIRKARETPAEDTNVIRLIPRKAS